MIVYWAVVVLTILITLAVAGRSYIREAVNRPEPGAAPGRTADLEDRWWASLAPRELVPTKKEVQVKNDFLALLEASLPEAFIVKRGLLAPNDTRLLVAGPSGLWVFIDLPWSGTVVKQAGVWKLVVKKKETVLDPAPDDLWRQAQGEIVAALQARLPQHAWTESLIQGGLVFSGALSGMVIAEIVRRVQRAVVRVVGSDIGWIDWKEQ